MTKNDKPVDLGALQDALKHARANYGKAYAKRAATKRASDNAYNADARAMTALDKAKEAVERAQAAMIEGARTVANG